VTLANVILWACIIIGLLLGAFGFIFGGLNRKSVWFAVIMVLSSTWAMTIFLAFGGDAQFQIDNAAWINMPPILLYYAMPQLALAFVDIPKKVRWYGYFCSLITVGIFLSLMFFGPNFLLLSAHGEGDAMVLEFNPVTLVMLGFQIIFLAILTAIVMVRAMRQARTELGRKLIRNVIIGYFCGFVAGGVFNIAMSSMHWIHWVGPTATLFFAFTMYAAVVKYGADEV